MQVPQTESPSEFTTSAVLTAYKALPESLRPFTADPPPSSPHSA